MHLKPGVYIETSVVSYLTARSSSKPVAFAHQEVTRNWWKIERPKFELFTSEITLTEARSGNLEAAQNRMTVLENIPLLLITENVTIIAESLLINKALPTTALPDALHIAVAAANAMEYILTWNFKHIANASMKHTIERVCRECGVECPVICTPEELFL